MTQPYQSLAEMLLSRAEAGPSETAFRFWSRGHVVDKLTFGGLRHRALRSASAIADVAPEGGAVLLMHPPGLGFIVDLFGCMIAGATAVPVPPPTTKSGERRFAAILDMTRAGLALTDAASPLPAEMAVRWPRLRVLAPAPATSALSDGADDDALPGPSACRRARAEDVAVIQFTSGSSADPKGAMLTHAGILANLSQIRTAFDIQPDLRDEAILVWLPHFHDMGLFGRLESVFAGCPGNVMSPREFMRRPLAWLEHAASSGATVTGGPNFAFDLCVEAAAAGLPERLDLSRLRVTFSGAEPIRPATLRAFAGTFAPAGLDPLSLTPCYGLAEATLMVSAHRPGTAINTRPSPSAPDVGTGSRRESADRDIVACGRPVEGLEIAILDPETLRDIGKDRIGEIAIAGPNVMSGYLGRSPSSDAFVELPGDATHRRFLRTGDLGFLAEGELFVCGRLKATIVVNGANIHAHDIEDLVPAADPLFTSARAAAFGVETDLGERPAVIVEVPRTAAADPGLAAAAEALAMLIKAECGTAPAFVAVRPRGTIASTTSGKIAYAETIGRFHATAGEDLARWPSPVEAIEVTAIEAAVIEAMSAVLGRAVADIDAPIVSLGGDSTSALRLSARLAARYGDVWRAGDLDVGDSARTIARKLDARLAAFVSGLSDAEVEERLLRLAPTAVGNGAAADGARP